MARSDHDHALQLLDMAVKDQTALANMLNAKAFSDEVLACTRSRL
jgi:hypothetical protein